MSSESAQATTGFRERVRARLARRRLLRVLKHREWDHVERAYREAKPSASITEARRWRSRAARLTAASRAVTAADPAFRHRPSLDLDAWESALGARLATALATNADGAAWREAFAAYAGELADGPAAPAEIAQELRSISVDMWRNRIADRTVCLVGDGVAGLGLGERIDAYDVVVRFGDIELDAVDTGTVTHVHVIRGTDGPRATLEVDTRIVLARRVDTWTKTVAGRLVPGAQSVVGDRSIRWPLRDPRLARPDDHEAASDIELVARVLDRYDANPVIDLVGVDSEAFRDIARAIDGGVVSLRTPGRAAR